MIYMEMRIHYAHRAQIISGYKSKEFCFFAMILAGRINYQAFAGVVG